MEYFESNSQIFFLLSVENLPAASRIAGLLKKAL